MDINTIFIYKYKLLKFKGHFLASLEYEVKKEKIQILNVKLKGGK